MPRMMFVSREPPTTPVRWGCLMPASERIIWLEPGDEKPANMQLWLREQGFDISRPIQHMVDKDGWDWWLQGPQDQHPDHSDHTPEVE